MFGIKQDSQSLELNWEKPDLRPAQIFVGFVGALLIFASYTLSGIENQAAIGAGIGEGIVLASFAWAYLENGNRDVKIGVILHLACAIIAAVAAQLVHFHLSSHDPLNLPLTIGIGGFIGGVFFFKACLMHILNRS